MADCLSASFLRRLTAIAAAILSLAPAAGQGLPAFPGADGAAGTITGGRGGLVYHVTKLDQNYSDSAPGTLRYGLNDANFANQPRTIVFDVAGTFWLGRFGADQGHDNGWDTQSRMSLGSNVTIAGQTAPGPVYIMGGVVKAGGNNTVLRNVTIAPGYGMRNFSKPDEGIEPTPGDFPDSYVYDAIDISGTNQMIDHVTAVYATDETISANELANNITIQYTTMAQAQNYPQADAEGGGSFTGHGLGMLLQAGSNAKITVANNLLAHMKARLPRVGSEVGSGPFNDFRNNVFYNWLGSTTQVGSGQKSFNNFIGNFYLAGAGGEDPIGGTNPGITNRAGGTGVGGGNSTNLIYQKGNLRDINKDGDALDASAATLSSATVTQAYDVNIGVTNTASDAYRNVLNHVGANWWNRSPVDTRLVSEVRTGAGKIKAWADDPFNPDPAEGTEWREMLSYRANTVTGAAPFTRDANWDQEAGGGDGMPTWWENEHGLNPFADDNNGDFDSDGYTNLEEYLNDVSAWPAPAPIQFTGGVSSRYALIQNWTVSGVSIPIQGKGTVTTSSNWQPSRYDEVQIRGAAVVDAVGQNAGSITVGASAAGSLSVNDGWLKVTEMTTIGPAGSLTVNGGKLYSPGLSKNATGSFALTGGELHVDAADFDLAVDGGTLAPGATTSVLLIAGGLTINDGTLLIDITPLDGATGILAQDLVTLGGNLIVNLNGFTPAPTDAYTIIEAAAVSGVFDNAIGDRLPVSGGSFLLTTDANSVVLSDYLASLPGDFNFDGSVDAADYTVWRDGLGSVYSTEDYAVWADAYGNQAVPAATSSVPEPSGWLLALMAGAVRFLPRRCRDSNRSQLVMTVNSRRFRSPLSV
jgi:hypothetical protein